MGRPRQLSPLVLTGVLAVVVVAVGVIAAVVLFGQSRSEAVADERVHRVGGFALRAPHGWVDHRSSTSDDSVLLELAEPPVLGVTVRGLWVSRWSASEGDFRAWVASPGARESDDVSIAGVPAVRRVEPMLSIVPGWMPDVFERVRVRHRLWVDGSIYELGFWGNRSDAGSLQRAVAESFRLFPPDDRRLEGGRFALVVPGAWNPVPHEHRADAVVAFESPGEPATGWVYVFERAGSSLADAADRLVADVTSNGTRVPDLVRADATIAGRPAVHLRFTFVEESAAVSSIDEYLVAAADGVYLLVALGHRGDERAAELDRILAGFEPR